MLEVTQEMYEAMQKAHPIEAACLARWIVNGKARIVPSPSEVKEVRNE